MSSERVFISWEPSNSRSASLAREFSARCYNIHYFALKRPFISPLKYTLQAFKTWQLLRREKPRLVFVQNPPVFAPLAVWLYCAFSKSRFIIDSHTGVFLEGKWKWLSFLHAFLVRRAIVSIVTNDHLGSIVERWGGKYFVFPDVPIKIDKVETIDRPRSFVTVVNSFSYDEPLAEIVAAAGQLPDVNFAITGDLDRCPPEILNAAPDNVHFTGFVSRQEYLNTLGASDAAVILTTENHTMQRGAYEAMALGVPIITSDWPLLRKTFFKGARYSDNTRASIEEAIQTVLDDLETFKRDVADLRSQRAAIWAENLANFMDTHVNGAVPGA